MTQDCHPRPKAASRHQVATSWKRSLTGPLIVAAAALTAVLLTLDPADCRPSLPQGPGLTLDESFNVQMGVYLAQSLHEYGIGILHPDSAAEVFGAEGYNPDHPVLGRLWLGIAHQTVESLAPARLSAQADLRPARFAIVSARAGSAAAFALTILLAGAFTGRRWGPLAGTAASLFLALMPRLFGHAHIAALETVMNLFWTIALLTTAAVWSRSDRQEGPSTGAAILTGFVLGLALLTKIQGVLLPPVVAVWAFAHWRLRALRPLSISAAVAAGTFVIGWPWLWLNLPESLIEYFGRTTDRTVLHVWYLGERFVDRDVPWHYPWVLFAATVPAGILLTGLLGCTGMRRSPWCREQSLLVLSVAGPLLVFSLPGVAVYDGVRLFLVSFPGWAILAGTGTAKFHIWLAGRRRAPAGWTAAFVLSQAAGVVALHPYHLSYYSAIVGGTAGAARLGFEANYWGDGISRELLAEIEAELPTGAIVEFAPLMHPYQLQELYLMPVMERSRLRLIPYGLRDNSPYLLVFHRLADAPHEDRLRNEKWALIADVQRQGVRLASLWQKQP